MFEIKEDSLWRETFFKENFNVDQCLSRYTLKSDLETLRNDLKNYGNELHQQMSEILKTETEAIVNLAEYLTNLNSKIDDLSLPVSQLREEIKSLHDLISNAQKSYINILQVIKSNSSKQSHLDLKFAVILSATCINKMMEKGDLSKNSIVLEHVVNKFSFEFNYLKSSSNPDQDFGEIELVGRKLTDLVNKTFLSAVENNDSSVILQCLRMYDNLERQSEAEKTYQIHVVRPAINNIFTETYLENCGQDIEKIYKEALNFVDTKIKTLLDTLRDNPELKSFNFVLNSFWVEVDQQSREGLPYITAPGNPELFQKRFKSTWNFLEAISSKCGNHPSFQEHIKRFNLPVYFEIRFQQIAGQFEGFAVVKPGINAYAQNSDNEIKCKLEITLGLWEGLQRCFHQEVFINNLADQFLKLSLLLLSRYLKWFEISLKDVDLFTEGSTVWEDFVVNSLIDLNLVDDLIGNKRQQSVDHSIYRVMPRTLHSAISHVFALNSSKISKVTQELQKHLISIKSSESLGHLQNVASIPRLYRRTNRSAPKEASNYMIEAVAPILNFNAKYKTVVQNQVDSVISTITKQYLSLVEDVLRSVCKTEESLRRLKNRSASNAVEDTSGGSGSETMSDEMKIREQIKMDVRYFYEKMYPLGLVDSKRSMDELKRQTC